MIGDVLSSWACEEKKTLRKRNMTRISKATAKACALPMRSELVALKTNRRGPDTCLIPPPTTMLFLHKPHKTSPILVITGPSNKKSIIALLQTFQEQDSTVIKIASRQAKPLTVKLGAKATVIH